MIGPAANGSPAGSGVDATAQTEHMLARAVALFRIGGLLEMLLVVAADIGNYRQAIALPCLLILAVLLEGTGLCFACFRRRRIPGRWVLADFVFVLAALAVGAVIAAPRYHRQFFMYPFSILGSVAFGLYFRRLSATVAATMVLAGDYLVMSSFFQDYPLAQQAVNAFAYFPNTVVAWAVGRQLRRTGAELQASRQREAELARENERHRHARILHDRVLQTLETLATGDWVPDQQVRAHIGIEAAWLRGLVEGAVVPRAGGTDDQDLLLALHGLVARCVRHGLRVELNASALRVDSPWRRAAASEVGMALVDATGEALTNVRKHAGVDTAVVRVAISGDQLTLSVLDHGRGFDPATAHRGIGLAQSIRARIVEVGGSVRIDSAPGAGTYVEIILSGLPV